MAAGLRADFTKRFRGGPEIHGSLHFPSDPPGVTVLFGPSGSAKTTMLRCLAGVERPDAGFIRYGDATWFDAAKGTWVPPERRGVGLMHQDYALFPHLTVGENVRYGVSRLGRAEAAKRAGEVMEMLGISGLAERGIAGLSGGEAQRVALARALAPKPGVLLLDEPLSALDGPSRMRIRGDLRALLRGLGIPVAVVTHDRAEAMTLGDRACVVLGGRVRQAGGVAEVFAAPCDGEVADGLGFENVVPVRVVSVDGASCVVEMGGRRVVVVARCLVGAGRDAMLCVRAEDVLIEVAGADSSHRSHEALTGKVVASHDEGAMLRVRVNAGATVWALVSKGHLALHEGVSASVRFRGGGAVVVPASSRGEAA